MDLTGLIERIKRIEAIYEQSHFSGEKEAAAAMLKKMKEKVDEDRNSQISEFKFTFSNHWSRKLFCSLLRRYDIKPYRYSGQRYTTVMAKTSQRIIEKIIWPEFQEIDSELWKYFDNIADSIISKSVYKESKDAEVIDKKLIESR